MKRKLIIALLVGAAVFLSACGESETSTVSETMVESELETETETEEFVNEMIDVTFDVSYSNLSTGLYFNVHTNLPEGTNLMFTLTGKDYTAQANTIVMTNMLVVAGPFTDKGSLLEGVYNLKITSGLSSLQDDKVKKIIGQKGEYLTGQYVDSSLDESENVVTANFDIYLKLKN